MAASSADRVSGFPAQAARRPGAEGMEPPVDRAVRGGAPLPPQVVGALRAQTLDPVVDDLDISFGSSRREVFGSVLDAASVLDDPLPPAAPAPDLPY